MSFILSILRARGLDKELQKYRLQRESSIQNQVESRTSCASCCKGWKESSCYLKIKQVFRQNSYAYFCIRSLFLYFGGALLTLVFFMVLALQLEANLTTATLVSSVIAPFLTVGLVVSERVRGGIALLLPMLASKWGRRVLIMYVLFLALAGPGANLLHNIAEMTESLSCALEQSMTAMGMVGKAIKQPLLTAKRVVAKALKAVRNGVAQFRHAFSAIEKVVVSIGHVFSSAANWLKSVVNVCNRSLGTPTERCMAVLHASVTDCAATLGPTFSSLCNVVYVAGIICQGLHLVGLLCQMVHMVVDAASESVRRAARRFSAKMRAALFVEVEFQHSFTADLETGNVTLKSTASAVRNELVNHPLIVVMKFIFGSLGGLMALTSFFVFIQALRYYHSFKKSDRFDNYWITQRVCEIDVQRARQGQECVLPLRPEERRFFCKPMQLRLLRHELNRLLMALVPLIMSTLHAVSLPLLDFCLHWLLDLIRIHTLPLVQAPKPMLGSVKLEVLGRGILGNMFRNITATLQQDELDDPQSHPDLEPLMCVPNPREPDFGKYYQIGSLLVLAWFLTLVEPLVLRLRPVLLSAIYPERAEKRAIWLVRHVLRERGGTLRTLARLVGSRTGQEGRPREPLTCREILEMFKDRFLLCRLLLGGTAREGCVQCATPGTLERPLRECGAFTCEAKYCNHCYQDLDNVCAICGLQLEMPDLPPDLQLETDSSSSYSSSDESLNEVNVNQEDPENTFVGYIRLNRVPGTEAKQREDLNATESEL